MIRFNRARAFQVGIALIAIVNAVVLGGVAYNRSGEPDSRLVLSEREVSTPYRFGRSELDDTRAFVALNVRTPSGQRLLDDDKARAVGLDTTPPEPRGSDGRARWRLGTREVLFVLEFDGEQYQRALQDARASLERPGLTPDQRIAAFERLRDEQQHHSRLFVVDVGIDRDALRARHPDRSRYAIVHGTLRPYWLPGEPGTLDAYFGGLSTTDINVSQRIVDDADLRSLGIDSHARPALFTIAFGRRLEPMVEAVVRRTPEAPARSPSPQSP
jgi:hypothetical protein